MATRKFRIKIDGKVFEAEVEEIGGETLSQTAPKPQAAQKPAPVPQTPISPASGNSIIAPMPGKIIAVKVSKGQQIKQGDVVIILEAMKMEQEIKSPLSGSIADIFVAAGDTVRKEQALITVG
jgi:glutaconyl-CoA/methylmalonyl-CoA decarboxylase subunit gamma